MLSLADRQQAYTDARDHHGMTVEEWENAQGLPPFSVYPAARAAHRVTDDGWFMYREREAVLAEEDRQMQCLRVLGITRREISRMYGCSMGRVTRRWA